jgi:hypothetical protein
MTPMRGTASSAEAPYDTELTLEEDDLLFQARLVGLKPTEGEPVNRRPRRGRLQPARHSHEIEGRLKPAPTLTLTLS